MHNLEEVVSKWERGAILADQNKLNGRATFHQAAFVYAARGGFAWIDPRYADPSCNPSSVVNVMQGKINPFGSGLRFSSASATVYVMPFDETAIDLLEHGTDLQSFFADLKARGIQWADERARARKLITRSIKEHAADMKAHKAAEEA